MTPSTDDRAGAAPEARGRPETSEDGTAPTTNGRAASREDGDVLALVSHELRDPLAAIACALAALNTVAVPRVAKACAIIGRQLAACLRLVDDLLDESLVSRNVLTVRLAPVSVSGFLAAALEATAPGRDARRHQLVARLPDPSVMVRGDATRLSQLVGNLLANASRYTPPGGRIELWTDMHENRCVVHVKDNGEGMDVDTLCRAFDPYFQGDHLPASEPRGLGLGLSLARAIADLHGGILTASSAGPGQGSEFRFQLPRGPSPLEAHGVAAPA